MPTPPPGSSIDSGGNSQIAQLECARRAIPGALVYTLVVAVVWLCTDYGSVFPALVAGVAVFLFIFGAIRVWTAAMLLRLHAPNGAHQARRGLLQRLFLASTIGSFAVWGGFSGYTAFHYVSDPKGFLVLLSSAALVAAATTSLAPNRSLAFLCVSLISLPIIASAALRPEPEARGFAVLSLVYLLFLLYQVHLNWRAFWTAYRVDEAEAARQEAVCLAAAKSLLLATMSHEVRTPMNGVIGMIELVLRNELPEEAREYANHARASAINLLGVLNGILAYSRNEKTGIQLTPSDFELLEWLRQVVFPFTLQARQNGVAVHLLLDLPDPSWYRADPIRLSEVLTNLLSNAVKFTHSGSIAVAVSHLELSPELHQLRFAVRDTGQGMSAAVQAQLFQPFGHSSTAAGAPGVGLGLSITRQIVDAMGGRITLESEYGKGTEFQVLISMAVAQPQSPLVASPHPLQPVRAGLSALVVEDDPVSGLIAKRILEKLGVSVDLAINGRQALEFAQSRYDMFLLDIQLPDTNGFEIAATLRTMELHRNALIVVVSANRLEDLLEQGAKQGVDVYLAKPYAASELATLVQQAERSIPKGKVRYQSG